HERLSEVELQPISAAAPGRERRRPKPVIPPGAFVVLIFVGLIVALYLLDPGGSNQPSSAGPAATQPTRPPATPPPVSTSSSAPRPQRVRLALEATGDVYVCLKAGTRTLLNGVTLTAGARTPTFRARRFRLTLGNNAVRLRINGRPKAIAASADPIGLEITPRSGRRPLPASRRPVCQ
ncbi:MAG TPA: hypothetical protein VGO81_02960, partial [Solirubrobacteraceae bacterium]|nr:hypothetical protein [Solirubrobacteraceae bacterium]